MGSREHAVGTYKPKKKIRKLVEAVRDQLPPIAGLHPEYKLRTDSRLTVVLVHYGIDRPPVFVVYKDDIGIATINAKGEIDYSTFPFAE